MRIALFSLISLLIAPFASAQPASDDAGAAVIEGIWQTQLRLGPAVSGPIELVREDGGWRAHIAGATAQGAELDFSFPEGAGRFRGVLHTRANVIEGFWTQPPGLPGQAYVTPVRLRAAGKTTWRGDIAPLSQAFTLYLRVFRADDGQWVGAFRNPEFNLNGNASHMRVAREGDDFVFARPDGGGKRKATLDKGGLRLDWPPVPQSLVLQRMTNADAYRPRSAGPFLYRAPQTGNDGWRVRHANVAGFDEAALRQAVQRIVDADPFSGRPQLIHSLQVARQGRLVLDEYFFGFDEGQPHDIRSAGKTFASTLIGAAMQEGKSISPGTRIYPLLAAQGPFANPDPRKNAITLAHLMTHTSGLDCNDNDEASRGNEGAMQSQSEQTNWRRFALDLPLAHDPGARYAYCTAGMNLVGAALGQITGETVPELFDRLIAKPMQFGLYHWNLAPDGEGYLGGGAYMRPRDLLKLGQVFLDGGVWNGRRIVSAAWVRDATRAHVAINETTTGMSKETFASVATYGEDGYAWHRYGVRVGEKRVDAYEANGNGGQFLVVVPEYDLVVVITGGNYGQGGIWTRWRDDVIGAGIIGALRQ